LKNKGKYLRL